MLHSCYKENYFRIILGPCCKDSNIFNCYRLPKENHSGETLRNKGAKYLGYCLVCPDLLLIKVCSIRSGRFALSIKNYSPLFVNSFSLLLTVLIFAKYFTKNHLLLFSLIVDLCCHI